MQPGKRLVGKVAIVTGGASGIGAETARMFAQHGAKVLLTDSNSALGKSVANEISESGGTAMFATQDVCDEERWAAIVAETEKSHGRLDILCNISSDGFGTCAVRTAGAALAGRKAPDHSAQKASTTIRRMKAFPPLPDRTRTLHPLPHSSCDGGLSDASTLAGRCICAGMAPAGIASFRSVTVTCAFISYRRSPDETAPRLIILSSPSCHHRSRVRCR